MRSMIRAVAVVGALSLSAFALTGCGALKALESGQTVTVNLANAQAQAKTAQQIVDAAAQAAEASATISADNKAKITTAQQSFDATAAGFLALQNGAQNTKQVADNFATAARTVVDALPLSATDKAVLDMAITLVDAVAGNVGTVKVAAPTLN